MTGSPDDHLDGPDGDPTDPLGPLLRSSYLPAPAGAFERIRHRAARRRRLRAAAGGTAAVAVVAGALYVAGVLTPERGDEVVGPPASSSGPSTAPAPSDPPPTRPSGSPSTGAAEPGSPGTAAGGEGSATSTPTGGAPTTATPSAPDGTPVCAASQLTASLSDGDAGAGNLYRYLVLTNSGSAVCHVTGYPGLSMLDANGRQIGQPATRHALAYSPVVLKPGEAASATIHTVNHQGTCLPTSVELKMYPPGSRASMKFAGRITDCGNLFEITPFTAGRTGNPPA
jgi:Protein of unknown function (DUF4232)